MSWPDDYYVGSSDYPISGADETPDDPYFDLWEAADNERSREEEQ